MVNYDNDDNGNGDCSVPCVPGNQSRTRPYPFTAIFKGTVSKLTSGWKYTPFDNDNNKDNQDNSHGDKTNKSRIS